jgi:hypothetical protein
VSGVFDDPNLEFVHVIGSVSAELCATYGVEPDPPRTRALLYADVTAWTVTVTPPTGDVKAFYDKYLAPADPQQTRGWFTTWAARVPLGPRLSLVGSDGAPTVPELPDFEVFAFHVGLAPRQALVAAFDVSPGCHGTIEDVQQFIGPKDYGVISDEPVVAAVFHHKWAHGAFARFFWVQNEIAVKRDGNDETATARGTMSLDSLDAVAIETEANSARDYVRIGGSATMTTNDLVLQDGRVLGPDKVDLGAPMATPWTVYTDFSITPLYSSDPQMRTFQIRAHNEAYRYIARPFATPSVETLASVSYARTEGIPRRVYFLGYLQGVLP